MSFLISCLGRTLRGIRICTRVILVSVVLLVAAVSPGLTADRPTITANAHQQLSTAQELIHQHQWAQAEVLLDGFVRAFTKEPYAQALGWQMLGYLFHETGRLDQALEAFDQVLTVDLADIELRQQILYNSAQLLVQAERPVEAVKRIESWLEQAGTLTPEQRVRVAWIYYGAERYPAAAGHLETAIRAVPVPENTWLEMLVATLHNDEQYPDLTRWLPRLIERNPQDNRYWLQLAGAYLELGDEKLATAVLSAGYQQGVFQTSEDVVRLVQMYVRTGVPHRAARLLEQALNNGSVPATEQHQELLANVWLQAREIRHAARVLGQNARTGGDCETHLRVGHLLFQLEDWSAAREYLETASQRQCGSERADALLLLGMAAYHEGHFTQAREAFTQARDLPQQRRQAESWLELLQREQGRSPT